MTPAGVTGVGSAQGGRVVTSEELGASLGLTADWIYDRTGVRERRYLAEGETLSDLVQRAGEQALAMAGRSADEVDLFLVATLTGDDACPAQSVATAGALELQTTAITADVNAACTGFVTSLAHAAAMIESGRAKLAVIAGADALSRVTDYDDAKSAPLFGDGAGAVVVEPVDSGGIGPAIGGHDYQRKALHMTLDEKNLIRMRGREVYAHAVARICEATLQVLEMAGEDIADIDLMIAHQANSRIVEAVAEKLGLREDQAVLVIDDVGNTSAASIPIALNRVVGDGRLASGGKAVFTGFGGGFVWSSIFVEFGPLGGDGDQSA